MTNNFKLYSSDFLDIMNDRFENGNNVSLVVTGNSMSPFLCEKRDSVVLEKFSGNISKGDILFYKRKDEKCVLHRVYKIKSNEVWFIGDAQNYIEGPLDVDCILAECNIVVRKGKKITKRSFIWKFFQYVWINIIPMRYRLIKVYSKLKNNQ